MDTSPERTASSIRNVSFTTLILAVLLAIAATTAVFLAIIRFGERLREPSSTSAVNPVTPRQQDDLPFIQQGTVTPEGELTGIVYYPIPYASPPNLSVTPGGRYAVTKQDEFSFVWIDREGVKELPALAADIVKDVPALAGVLQKKSDETSIPEKKSTEAPAPTTAVQPQLTWEAKGVRATADSRTLRLFEQRGTFHNIGGSEGEVMFPYPYASPPNVELEGKVHTTLIVEINATGFKWKNSGTHIFDQGEASWIAKGIKATEVPK